MDVSNGVYWRRLASILLLLVVIVVGSEVKRLECVPRCECPSEWVVDCSNRSFSTLIDAARAGAGSELFMAPLVPHTAKKLDLSGNHISQLDSNALAGLRNPEQLIELDLSNNRLTLIAPGAFRLLKNLQKLNLSNNRLHSLNRTVFSGLASLQSLILDDNPLAAFPDKTFASLHSLTFISIRSPQLNCDCQMVDFRRWALRRSEDDDSKSVAISDRTRCVFPLQFRDWKLGDLRPKMLKRMCGKGDLNPEVFAIEPTGPSVIFYPGEDRSLLCKVSNVDADLRIEWLHNNAPVGGNITNHRQVSPETLTPDGRLRVAVVRLNRITFEDAGDWTCHIENNKSTMRRTIRLMPLPIGHEQCVEESFDDEKGEFLWPNTERGQMRHLECSGGPNGSFANRQCDSLGNWLKMDTSECDFASNTTRALWNLLTDTRQQHRLTQLANITTAAAEPLVSFDVRVASWIVGNTSINASDHSLFLVVASNLMDASQLTLRSEADLGAFRRRLAANEFASFGPVQSHKNLAMCQRMSTFAPLLLIGDVNETADSGGEEGLVGAVVRERFVCSEYKLLHWLGFEMVSVRMPFEALRVVFSSAPIPAYGLFRLLWMRTPRLFDSVYSADGEWVAENDVLGVRIKRENSTIDRLFGQNPLSTDEERETSGNASLISPVVFTFELGTPTDQVALGAWEEASHAWRVVADDVCARSRIGRAGASFSCQPAFLTPYFLQLPLNISYFTVLQNATVLAALRADKTPVVLMAWMYASAGFLSCCLLVTIIVHVFCVKSIGASTKLRHCLINCWLSLCAVSLTFTLGIDKVHLAVVCECVGVVTHYSALAALLWLVLTLRTIQRKTWKAAYPTARSEEESPFPVSQHGPLVGLYFLAYGLPLIACSFALALDKSAYTVSGTFCFLSPMSGGLFYLWFFGPACLLLAIGGLFWLVGQCTATAASRRLSSMGADRTRNLSATMTTADDSAVPLMNNCSRRDDDQLSAQTSLVDHDLSSAFHIRTAGFLLTAYVIAVISAALYTWPPSAVLPYLPEYILITSVTYSVACCLMGVFVLGAHVSCRSDLKRRWSTRSPPEQPTMNGAATNVTVVLRAQQEERPAKRRRSQGVDTVPSNVSRRESPMGQSYSSELNGSWRSAKAERAMQMSAKKYYQRQREMKETGLNGSALSDVQTSVIVEENESDGVDVAVFRRRLTDAVSPVVEEHDYYNVEMLLADKAVVANGRATHGLSSETRF
uniref:Adhesion G protein-coupled receptor A3 n=1 Tax=Plectus sambesii TaxID=2011161 RepID=A0A914XAG8_9BILA